MDWILPILGGIFLLIINGALIAYKTLVDICFGIYCAYVGLIITLQGGVVYLLLTEDAAVPLWSEILSFAFIFVGYSIGWVVFRKFHEGENLITYTIFTSLCFIFYVFYFLFLV